MINIQEMQIEILEEIKRKIDKNMHNLRKYFPTIIIDTMN